MSGNLSLLAVLFTVCYFIKKGENYYVTTITRAHFDYFTDVCQNCYKYGAKREKGICKCEQSSTAGMGSVFLQDQRYCKGEKDLLTDQHCQIWTNSFVEVIDTEGTNSHLFDKGAAYSSYQLEPLISYRNSTTGEWQFFNLSGNVLMLQNGPNPYSLQIKVTQVSPTLTQFKGYVMKLGLKRKRIDGKTEDSCLLFKAKGKIHFALNCSVPTATPVSTTTVGLNCSVPSAAPVSKTTCISTTTTASSSTTTVSPTIQIVLLIQIVTCLVK